MRCLAGLLLLSCATPVLAEPAPPYAAPGISLDNYGIYCTVPSDEEIDAPNTVAGKVDLLPASPVFIYRQQQVPARLGVSFGVAMITPRDIPDMTIQTWFPGTETPDSWESGTPANDSTVRGFTFDAPYELITGTWRMEAWEGGTLLYRVEFDVVPADTLPGIVTDCCLLS
jgi:hypothetical protein